MERCSGAALGGDPSLLERTASWEPHVDIYRPLSTRISCLSGNWMCLSYLMPPDLELILCSECLRKKALYHAAHTWVTRSVPGQLIGIGASLTGALVVSTVRTMRPLRTSSCSVAVWTVMKSQPRTSRGPQSYVCCRWFTWPGRSL